MSSAGTAAFTEVYRDVSVSAKNPIEYRLTYVDYIMAPETPVARPQINHAAIALIRSWREEDAEQQRKDWEALKQVIDEDRSSDRKLFS